MRAVKRENRRRRGAAETATCLNPRWVQCRGALRSQKNDFDKDCDFNLLPPGDVVAVVVVAVPVVKVGEERGKGERDG